MVRYNNRIFKPLGQTGYGHFSVISEFDGKNTLIIGDPQPPHFKKCSLNQFFYSMSNQIDGIERGLYIVF